MSSVLSQPHSDALGQIITCPSSALVSQRQYLDSESLGQSFIALFSLLRRSYLTYYPSLARLAGSPKAGLMLGHALYYSKQLEQSQPDREGWFYMGGIDWFKATGLSVREQESARLLLCAESTTKSAFLQLERLGMPARLWYRVKMDAICQAISNQATDLNGAEPQQTAASAGSLDADAIKVLLGRVVVFYAELAHLTSSASAGIYLSQLINEYKFRASRQQLDGQGFAVAQDATVWQALFLGEKSVRNARDQAEASGWVTFKRANRRCGDLQYRVNIDTLSTAVSRFDLKAHCANQGGFALSVEQVLRKGQNLKSSERQMQFAYAQNAELVTRKGQEQMLNDGQNLVGFALSAELGFAQNAELGFALSAELVTRKGQNPIRVVKNSNNLQQEVVEKNTATSKIEPLASQEKLGGGYLSFSQKQKTVQFVDLKQLIIPNIILEVEYPTLQIILNKSKNPQLILDELLGQSKIRNIAAPCAYLRTLVNKELTGDLIIAHAHRIQAKRLASQQMAHALEASREGSHAANMLSTEAIALQAEQTQQGKEILAKLREQWARNTSPKQAKSESLEVVV